MKKPTLKEWAKTAKPHRALRCYVCQDEKLAAEVLEFASIRKQTTLSWRQFWKQWLVQERGHRIGYGTMMNHVRDHIPGGADGES